jgi:SPP1 family phage portal protein
MFIRSSDKKLKIKEIGEYLKQWDVSEEKKRLDSYYKYYSSENELLADRVKDRAERRKTPNNYIPTAYYKTVVDGMAGYMFQNVVYTGDEKIVDILDDNNKEIKDMVAGNNALMYNRGLELVYTVGDENSTDVKFTWLDPRGVILIFDDSIEPELFCAIRTYKAGSSAYEFNFDVIYADEWQYYAMKKGLKNNNREIVQLKDSKKLFFSSVPVVEYKGEIITERSPFDQVLGYIVALDWIVSGNANEIDRLVDALLVIGKNLKKEDLDRMPEWKALQGIKKEDRAEYLTKDMSPAFREYVSKLLIQEIHKHSHIVDWYSPDSGLSGTASGRALKTRLFDMDMYSNKIEKVYRIGAEKRISLINEILSIKQTPAESVEIVFNRTTPSDIEDKILALTQATFLSDRTKIEEAGFDYEEEKERMKEEAKTRQDNMPSIDIREDDIVE